VTAAFLKIGDSMAESTNKPARYFQQDRSELLGYVPATVERTLELGCGEGRFSALVKQAYSCEVWGVELNATAAEAARGRLDKLIEGDVIEVLHGLPDKHFDCIICNDILEHLVDPFALLVEARGKLRDGGVVVASIPNVRFCKNLFKLVFRGTWDYVDYGIMDRTHLRFFTYKSLLKMWPALGYELLRIEGLEPKRNLRTVLFSVLNLLLLNFFKDTRYVHFACVARPVQES